MASSNLTPHIICYHGSRWQCIGKSYALLCRVADCDETEIISGYCTAHYTLAIAHIEDTLNKPSMVGRAFPTSPTSPNITLAASKEHDEELRERRRYQPPPSFDPTTPARNTPFVSTAQFELAPTRHNKWFVAEAKDSKPTDNSTAFPTRRSQMTGLRNIPEGHMAK